MAKYTLHVDVVNTKSGKYLYTVKDADGKKVQQRRTDRVYVAAGVGGNTFCGRLDLIPGWLKEHIYFAKNPDEVAYLVGEHPANVKPL